jgi:hypothetical protein
MGKPRKRGKCGKLRFRNIFDAYRTIELAQAYHPDKDYLPRVPGLPLLAVDLAAAAVQYFLVASPHGGPRGCNHALGQRPAQTSRQFLPHSDEQIEASDNRRQVLRDLYKLPELGRPV